MKKLYFVRHGESQANHDNKRIGQVESPLTQIGRAEAAEAGQNAKSMDISTIYSSDLARALDTAKIIANNIGLETSQIMVDPRLREVGVGKLVGTLMDQKPDYWQAAHDPANPLEVESLEQVEQRLQAVYQDLKQAPGNVLVVSHNAVGLIFMRMLDHIADAQTLVDIPNSQIVELHKAQNLDRLGPS